jgi:hypothetical protein
MEAIDVGRAQRVPWNKGKLTGQKPPLKLRKYGRFASACSLQQRPESSQCSTWRSTAN